jgi:uncharacterized protein (DUF433 family)
MKSNLLKRITIEPDKLNGKPCIRGYRITVSHVLGLLGHGLSATDIIDEHPELELDDILACLLYASSRLDHSVVMMAAE